MNPFDDRLSDLLQNDGVDAAAPTPDLAAAMGDFRRRRQRRIAIAGGALSLAFVVAGAGLLAVVRDDTADRLVPATPPPTVEPDPTIPVTTIPTATVESAVPAESPEPTAPPTAVAGEVGDPTAPPPTVDSSAPPTTAGAPAEPTLPTATEGVLLVPFAEIAGLDQSRNDAFVDHAIVHDGQGWTFSDQNGVDSRYLASCPGSSSACSGSIQATIGDFTWAVVHEGDHTDGVPERSTLQYSLDGLGVPTELVEAPPGTRIEFGQPADGGLIYGVGYEGAVSTLIDVFLVNDAGTTVLHQGVIGAEVSSDGRYLAAAEANPPEDDGRTFVEVTDFETGASNRFEIGGVFDVPIEWSPDGRHLAMRDAFEDFTEFVIDPWQERPPVEPGGGARADLVSGSQVCFVDAETVVVGRWEVIDGDGRVVTGTAELVSLDDPATSIADLGLDLYASEMVCHRNGGITISVPALTERPDASSETTVFEIDTTGTPTIVHVSPSGDERTLVQGDVTLTALR